MKIVNKPKKTAISIEREQLHKWVSRLFKSLLMIVDLTLDIAHTNYSFGT